MSTPDFDPDDPRLTAYALDECAPAERETVERLLAASPEARAEVEQTRAFARALESEYRRENENYQGNQPADWPSGKVVKFPTARLAGWKPALAFAWKIAAVIVALGSLAVLAFRRTPAPQPPTLASVQSDHAAPPPAPVAQSTVAASPATASVALAPPPAETDQLPAAAKPPDDAKPGAGSSDSLVAMDSDRSRRDAEAAAMPAAPASEGSRSARFSARRETGAAAPAMSAASVPAGASGGRNISLADRLAGSVVRIRAGDGSYIGGVAVTADGWVLAARSLPAASSPFAAILADRREFPATVSRDESDAGLCRLRIDGAELSPVALATTTPADQAILTVASTDRHTGHTGFLRARAAATGAGTSVRWEDRPPAADATNFVFNANGELLASTVQPPADKDEMRAKAAVSRPPPAGSFVRPFSATERAFLQPPGNAAPH